MLYGNVILVKNIKILLAKVNLHILYATIFTPYDVFLNQFSIN
jgi:hypothetical protein